MWFILPIVCAFVGTGLVTDFFFVKHKSRVGEQPQTDATRVAKLYTEIKTIKSHTCKNQNLCDNLSIQLSSAFQTGKTIAQFKIERFLSWMLTPDRINHDLISVPYYIKGKWYNALIKHSSLSSRVISISVMCPTSRRAESLEKELRSYLGPNEDFYGHMITPADLGCIELAFTIYDGFVIRKLTFTNSDIVCFPWMINKL